jgi:hypothetical protein
MSSPRALLMLILALACSGEPDDGEAGDGETAAATATAGDDGASSGPTTGGDASGEPTTAGASATTTAGGETAGVDDMCGGGRPGGGWNACFVDGHIDNELCGWTMGDGPGTITCLAPASGSYNVCGLMNCVEDCDCFTPPTTGSAIARCSEILANGGKACVLYCAGGQICPDGMTCVSGTCYWPN